MTLTDKLDQLLSGGRRKHSAELVARAQELAAQLPQGKRRVPKLTDGRRAYMMRTKDQRKLQQEREALLRQNRELTAPRISRFFEACQKRMAELPSSTKIREYEETAHYVDGQRKYKVVIEGQNVERIREMTLEALQAVRAMQDRNIDEIEAAIAEWNEKLDAIDYLGVTTVELTDWQLREMKEAERDHEHNATTVSGWLGPNGVVLSKGNEDLGGRLKDLADRVSRLEK